MPLRAIINPFKAPICIAVMLVMGCLPAWSDVFELKNGSRIDGKVVSEDATSYTVEVQVTGSIKDDKVILKSDIRSIKKAEDDVVAFKVIEKLIPTPDGLSVDDYKTRIDMVVGFMTKYPSSAKVENANPILKALRDEMEKVQAGGMKLNGILYDAATCRANAYEMDATMQATVIRRELASGMYLQALRDFIDFEQEYAATQAYVSMLPLVIEAIGSYSNEISQLLSTLDQRIKERDAGLERMDQQSRAISERAIQEQAEGLESRFAQQKQSKQVWVTPHPFHKGSLEYTLSQAKSEIRRLDSRKTQTFVDGGKIYREVMALAKQGANKSAAEAAMRDVLRAKIPKRYADQLKAALDANLIVSEKEKAEQAKKEEKKKKP
jgi:hypothetical protein